MEQFEQEVEEYILEMAEFPNFDNILSKLVTNNEKLNEAWMTMKNNQSGICQRIIPTGTISFKCYTCFSNLDHQICQKCFDSQTHQNHKCLILYKEAICICGNTSYSFICKRHVGISESRMIPEQLQKRIKILLKAICQRYVEYMIQIKQQIYKYDQMNSSNKIMQMLHF